MKSCRADVDSVSASVMRNRLLDGEYAHPSSPGSLTQCVIATGYRQLQPQGEFRVGRVVAGELKAQSQAQQAGHRVAVGRGRIGEEPAA